MINHLDNIDISSQDIERQVKSYSLVFPRDRDETVEWGMKLPMFIYSFYKYIAKHNSIPSQGDFYNQYISDNKEWFKKHGDSEKRLKGIKARVFRAYPSIVRDIHFALVVKERGNFNKVIYNYDIDIQKGIDLVIYNTGYSFNNNRYTSKRYAVNLFTNTDRAFQGRNKKGSRHGKILGVEYIDMPISFKGSKKCGRFYLYHNRELDILRRYIG